MPHGVLCNAAQDIKGGMVPPIHLEEYEIVEALLLRPFDDRPGMSPTTAEEAILLGVSQSLSGLMRLLCSPVNT